MERAAVSAQRDPREKKRNQRERVPEKALEVRSRTASATSTAAVSSSSRAPAPTPTSKAPPPAPTIAQASDQLLHMYWLAVIQAQQAAKKLQDNYGVVVAGSENIRHIKPPPNWRL